MTFPDHGSRAQSVAALEIASGRSMIERQTNGVFKTQHWLTDLQLRSKPRDFVILTTSEPSSAFVVMSNGVNF